MNNFDLTADRIFSKKIDFNFLMEKPNVLSVFDDKFTECIRTGNVYVGTAKEIHMQKMCSGFGSNDGICDRCGRIIMPWVNNGLCEKCSDELEYEYKEKPEWLNNRSSFTNDDETPWFVV